MPTIVEELKKITPKRKKRDTKPVLTTIHGLNIIHKEIVIDFSK